MPEALQLQEVSHEQEEQFSTQEQTQLQEAEEKISFLLRGRAHNAFYIGQWLSRVRDLHGNRGTKGQGFQNWCQEKFSMSRRAAYRFISIYEDFRDYEHGDKLTNLIDKSALYLLTSGSCPKAARQEIIQRAIHGEKITHHAVNECIKAHKGARKRLSPLEFYEKLQLAKSQLEEKLERDQKAHDRLDETIYPDRKIELAQKIEETRGRILGVEFGIKLFASLKAGQRIPIIDGNLDEFAIDLELFIPPQKWGEFDIEICENLVSN